jgi:hypothetical protein
MSGGDLDDPFGETFGAWSTRCVGIGPTSAQPTTRPF